MDMLYGFRKKHSSTCILRKNGVFGKRECIFDLK